MINTKDSSKLRTSILALDRFDWERVRRPNLGDESLSDNLKEIEKSMENIKRLADKYWPLVHDDTVEKMVNTFDSIFEKLDTFAKLDNARYLEKREEFLESVKKLIEKAALWTPIVAGAAVLDSGILDTKDIMEEVKQERRSFRREAQRLREHFRDEATKLLREAETDAKKIEAKARDTAAGISVKAAQEQFKAASDHDTKQVYLWTFLAISSIAVLIGGAYVFLFADSLKMSEELKWNESLPQALFRILVLSALAGATTFTFRMLRAHLHIAEKNRHRVRVANCIEGFLQAAADPSQRDLILAKLTDSIVNYGDSGLVRHDRENRSATMPGELMGRIVAAISGKGTR